jgi:preprotein translocase subunit YajC
MSDFITNALAAEKPAPAAVQSATEVPAELPPHLSADKMLLDNLMILGALFFIFYFILIRPQQKRLKFHQAMLKGLAKGNKVITSGGLIGTITKFEGNDIAIIEVAQGVKVRVAKSAITETVDDKNAGGESANDN